MTSRQRIRGQSSINLPEGVDWTVVPREQRGRWLYGGCVLSLFLMRFYYVAESADQGETLGIVGLWLGALLVWAFVSWKSGLPVIRPGWFDLGVGLLAGGHILSALLIVASTGEKRSAINLAWEWMGVAISVLLLRQSCRDLGFRRELLAGLIATGTALAGLGLYQHYVDFPRMAARFGPMFDRLKEAGATEAALLRKEMARENIPIDGPGATLFEKRLRDSREPLGFFALANTFGGFLSVCLMLSVSAAVITRTSRKSLLFWAGIIALLGWSLLLTKSRTAWIGTAVGLALLAYRTQGTKLTWTRIRFVAVSLVLLGLAGWGLSRLGGLDRQVLTEAPKSMQYRLQYWSASVRMIRDHVLFGVGPGQFRSQYLFYKLPEASEEISDPHNLFLDVAANGGIVATIGLFCVCLAFGRGLRHSVALTESRTPHVVSQPIVVVSEMIGFAAVAWVVLLFNGSDDRLLIVLPMATLLFWGIRQSLGEFADNPNGLSVGFSSAAAALLIHLCGAGGIGMPSVSTLLLVLIAGSLGDQSATATDGKRLSTTGMGLIGTCSLGLIFAWYLTGLRPVTLVHEKLFAGDRSVERGQLEAADADYSTAAISDPWASEPWRRRAELASRKADAAQGGSNESFQFAVDLLQEARRRDPAGFRDDQRLGGWWLARWRKTADDNDIRAAVEAFRNAWNRYPTNVSLMADLALALNAAKSDSAAREMACQALMQDRLNHDRGHVDRFLDDATRLRLEGVCKEP